RPPTSPIQTSLQAWPSEASAPVNPLTDLAAPPTSPAGIVGTPGAASTATGAESNHDERGPAFALSPPSELAQRPSPPAEPQQQSQQEQTQQTPPAQMGEEETTPRAETAKPQDSADLVNGVVAVPGAATDTDTTPAKLSEKKAADDRLVTFAYRSSC